MATQVLAGMMQAVRPNTEAVAERNRQLFAAQQRARRGPTPEVFFVKHLDNSRLVKADDPARTREMRIFSIAMSILFTLVMVYGWQHFNSIEYGYKVEAQKQQRQLLKEQNHQLRLTEAQLCDPVRIDRMARRLGMDAPKPGQVVRPDSVSNSNEPVMAQASPVLPTVR